MAAFFIVADQQFHLTLGPGGRPGRTPYNPVFVIRRFHFLTFFVFALSGATAALCADASAPAAPAVRSDVDGLPPELQAILNQVQSPWSVSASVEASAGYKDNLLLSKYNPERSSFVRGGFEALVWHIPRARIDYFGFVNAERTHYFNGITIDHDSQAFAGFEWRYRIPDTLTVTFDTQGYYLDQIFDNSDTEIRRSVAKLIVSGMKVGPNIKWYPAKWLWIGGTVHGSRETFRDGTNNATIRDSVVSVGWVPHERIELEVRASENRRAFDIRHRYDDVGILEEGMLRVHQRVWDATLATRVTADGKLKMETRVGGLRYLDNGGGYLNYRQHHYLQQVQWSPGKWQFRLDGEVRRKTYEKQIVGHGFAIQPVIKEEYGVGVAIERELSPRWSVFGKFSWERTRSNDLPASYRVNEGLLGCRWNWEK